MNPGLPDALAARLAALADRRERANLARVRICRDGPPAPRARVGATPVLNFAGNDYLGLAGHPCVARALAEAAVRYGAGSGASALVAGYTPAHARLERALAHLTGRERTLVLPSGYHANLAVLGALARRGDQVFADRLCHASLIDAALLSRVRLQRYAHGDGADLQRRLRAAPPGALRFVITEGVFSMDGDCAPIPELARVARDHGAVLMVDDAHGLGALGPTGGGTLELHRADARQVPILVGTLGKAFGTAGGFVAGDAALIEAVLQHGRTYAYTTALAPALAAAAGEALRLSRTEPWRRQHLAALVARFGARARAAGLRARHSDTPIQPFVVGDAARAVALSRALRGSGFHVPAIRPPTVPAGASRLRISLSAVHRAEQIDALVDALAANSSPVDGG